MKLVLMGPPHSGKSVFREGLKQAIRSIPGAKYPYVITACPDGEGSWFQATSANHPQVAAESKATHKGSFTPEFVNRISNAVANCQLELTIVDVGGIVSDENRQICRTATHSIILAGDLQRVPEWREFCAELNINILAEIQSDYNGQDDNVPEMDSDGVYRGSVHYLERGVDTSQRPAIKRLAEILA